MNICLPCLYETNSEFRRYVDAWRAKTGESVDEVLKYITVKEYAKYVLGTDNA